MTTEKKEVEKMEKFMTVLMEVKVSMERLYGKVDQLTEIRDKVDKTYDKAHEANNRSKENAGDIKDLREDMKVKADKDDVERIVRQKDNWQRNLPAWAAVAISIATFLMAYLK